MSVCMSVPSHLIANYAQTVRVSVFCHKKSALVNFFLNYQRTSNLYDLKKNTAILRTSIPLWKIFYLPFTRVEIQIDKLQKKILGKSILNVLLSEFVTFATKNTQTKIVLSLQIIVDLSRSRTAAASCCAYWGN